MRVTEERLAELRQNPSTVFNVCILAHVDHGKTSLADSLVATAGLVPTRMAGRLRFLDYRPDEQERGITLKSSGVTIPHHEKLVNLIDSPGHVDFSGEVSTAVRLCDGAIVVVDVVEGVCAQTRAALRVARQERLCPLLVLNKLDRLALELQLTPIDAYARLMQLLEQLNAIMASDLTFEEPLEEEEDYEENLSQCSNDGPDDYFVPANGNVVFASALDAWGFRTDFFAHLYSERLGVSVDELREALWGDFYISGKPPTVRRGGAAKAKKPLFVSLILDNLWSLYDTICVRRDKDKLGRIIETLGLKVTARDLRQTDSRALAQAVLSQWLPLGTTVLDAICDQLPSASSQSEEKIELLMTSGGLSLETYPPETQALKKHFLACDTSSSVPTIVLISKMFAVPRNALPQKRVRPTLLSGAELAAKREAVRQARIERKEQEASMETQVAESTQKLSECSITATDSTKPLNSHEGASSTAETPEVINEEQEVFVALARVYSGTLRPGQSIYVLGPKHDPSKPVVLEDLENLTVADLKGNQHVTKAVVGELYTLLGRELAVCHEAPSGSVIGIGGLTDHVLKSATLSTELACPPFCALSPLTVPILRVAVEPAHPSDLPALRKGLRLLNQADACVQVLVQETGEHVLMTAGELHLERCLRDLHEQFAKVEINVSEPIIPFRETIVPPPKVDMANEVIEGELPALVVNGDRDVVDGVVTVTTPDKQSTISIQAEPLSQEVVTLLERNAETLRILAGVAESGLPLDGEVALKAETLRSELTKAWDAERVAQIWCFRPRRNGPNILLAAGGALAGSSIWSPRQSPLSHLEASLVAGFDAAVAAGPLCEEPMRGVCFAIREWKVVEESAGRQLAGQVLSVTRDACRRAFQAQPQRLVAAMYQCHIASSPEVVGKVHGVVARRLGRVLKMDAGPAACQVTSVLPVIESLRLAQELRKATSGLASAQLVFSHWETLEADPFWTPRTEEELVQFGDAVSAENRARVYIDSVRRRKGLPVQAQIVQHAEKQRTLSKKK